MSACKWKWTNPELQARATTKQESGPVLYATDRFKLDDIRDFYLRVFGQDEYSTLWSESERFRSGSGIPERKPYLDSWYPERTGGTNLANSLTRYDKAFYNAESKAAAWEMKEHNHQQPDWYGHCNGTSAASIRYVNPQNKVLRPTGCTLGVEPCTEFTPGDIRALLSEISMNTRAKFLSGNRCTLSRAELDQRPPLRSNPLVMDDCDDVNPGSFHLALINFLGRMKQPLIFDYNQDEPVWNYPLYSYSYSSEGPFTEAQAVAATGLPIDSWVFNPKAVSWYKVAMTVNYRISNFGLDGAGTVPADLSSRTYDYILELDDEGHILGGEWIGDSRRDHPDFIWMPFEPAEPTGDVSYGNPEVNNEEVIKLWAESVGLDPSNPFRGNPKNAFDVRFYPQGEAAWGLVNGYYQMILDGSNAGSVFLGKKAHLRIELSDPIKTDSSVEVILNGQSIGTNNAQDGKIDVLFDAIAGINLLNLRWTSTRVDSAELNWDFRFYAM